MRTSALALSFWRCAWGNRCTIWLCGDNRLCWDCEEHRRVEAIRAGANKRRRARFLQVAVIHEPQVDETREMARPPLPAAPRDIPAPRGLLEGVGATPPDAPEGPCLGTIQYSAGSSAAAHG